MESVRFRFFVCFPSLTDLGGSSFFESLWERGLFVPSTVERAAVSTLVLRLCGGELANLGNLGDARGSICGRVFKRGELIYRCKCALPDSMARSPNGI